MKRSMIVIVALAATTAHAQSVEDGIKMYRYERYNSAEKILGPLAGANPTANYYYGLSQMKQNDVNAAKATFMKFPEDPMNMAGQALVAFNQNNMSAGTQLANNVAQKAKKKEWQPLEYAADAITYSGTTDLALITQAIAWYKKALESTDDANVHIGLGDASQLLTGGGGEAMNNYEHVTEKDPKNSLAFSRIGYVWYSARNYPSALDNYQKAKDADPTNPLPYRDLANAYERSGNYAMSLQNMQQYLSFSDKSVDDEVQYMGILYLSKHYPEAIHLGDSLISIGAKKATVYGPLGYSQYETKDYPSALSNLRTYFAIKDPKKIGYDEYVKFGNVFAATNAFDSADVYYNKAGALDTARDKSDIYRPIAENYKTLKQYAKSAYWYNKITAENPGTQPLDYFWGGVMYYYAAEYNKADPMFEQMGTRYSNSIISATYWRGRVAAAIDSDATTGAAVPYYTRWLDSVGQASEKKGDVKIADDYLLFYYYNKKDKANEEKYKGYLKTVDSNDSYVKQLDAIEAGAGKKPAPKAAPKKK